MSKLDDERWKNFIFLHTYATDEEVAGVLPIAIVAGIVLCVLVWIFS